MSHIVIFTLLLLAFHIGWVQPELTLELRDVTYVAMDYQGNPVPNAHVTRFFWTISKHHTD